MDKNLTQYPDVLSVADIQDILKIGRKSVYKLIENGELYAVRPGKSFLISKKSLIQYLNGERKSNAVC